MNYHNISYPDMNNGDGLRVVLWLSGCSHHCLNCQNPQTWNPNSGIPFDADAREELYKELNREYISGITLSGGDPLYSANEILSLVREIKEKLPTKTIWLYTGYTWEQIMSNQSQLDILPYIDVLVDGRYIDSERDVTLKWRGSKNQRVINVQESLRQNKVILWCD